MLPFIDVHCHIGVTVSRARPVGQTAVRYMARMAGTNIRAAIISPTAGGPQARGVLDTREQNRAIAVACKAFPDRFPIGLAVVEVRHERAGVEELARATVDDGLVGFMCHPVLSGHALEAEMYPFLDAIAAIGGLCLLHQTGSSSRIAALARRYPNISFIVGHASCSREGHEDVIEHCGRRDNIWLDIAQKTCPEENAFSLLDLASRVDVERLMFGSDAPYDDFRLVQRLVQSGSLTPDLAERIAFANAERLIRRFRPEWRLPETSVRSPVEYTDKELWEAEGRRLL